MPISYITFTTAASDIGKKSVMLEMGMNDICTYPFLHTHHFLKMFLDLFHTFLDENDSFSKRSA